MISHFTVRCRNRTADGTVHGRQRDVLRRWHLVLRVL